MPEPRVWVLREERKPMWLNDLLGEGYRVTGPHTKAWRMLGRGAVLDNDIPPLHAVTITSQVHCETLNDRPDIAAEAAATKGFIDGLMDEGVCRNDNPDHMRLLTYLPPVVDGTEGVTITVTEVLPDA